MNGKSRSGATMDGMADTSSDQVIDAIAVGTVIVDEGLVIHRWNRFMEDHTGIPADQAVGQAIDKLMASDRMAVLRRKVGNVLRLGHYEFIDARIYGHVLPIRTSRTLTSGFEFMQQSCIIVPFENPSHGRQRVCISISDDTHIVMAERELQRIRSKLEKANRIDALTGILNRGTVLAAFNDELARAGRYGRPLSVALLDIDFFKAVNDNFGHLAGDEVLRQVAGTLQHLCRTSDSVGRYGGEEFVVVLPETDEDSALAAAERLRVGIEALAVRWGDHAIHPTASFGVVQAHPNATRDEALNAADEALYAAKSAGRNRVRRGALSIAPQAPQAPQADSLSPNADGRVCSTSQK